MPRAREPQKPGEHLPTEDLTGDLEFTVEHWDGSPGTAPRVIARAENLRLAEAMFEAAATDYPAGLTLLKRGEIVLRRTGR